MKLVCAWCQTNMGEVEGGAQGMRESHGLCLDCLGKQFPVPVVRVDELDAEEADRLPYGRIVLDEHDRVIAYNRTESELSRRRPEAVIGKNFFESVAPCTNVRELAGWVADCREAGIASRTELDFIFDFPFGKALVHIALVYEPLTGHTTILVARIAEAGATAEKGAAANA